MKAAYHSWLHLASVQCIFSECKNNKNAGSGDIYSPGYGIGVQFPEDLSCFWSIKPDHRYGSIVKLEFHDFEVGDSGCQHGKLQINTTDVSV